MKEITKTRAFNYNIENKLGIYSYICDTIQVTLNKHEVLRFCDTYLVIYIDHQEVQ